MPSYWEKLKEAYDCLHNNRQGEADIMFNNMYTEFITLDYNNDKDLKINLINCILWLWEINMKKWKFDTSLEFYELWNKITDWNDFNILFNLWVVYRNLWQEEKSSEMLNIAQELEPENINLINFINWNNNNEIKRSLLEYRIEEDFVNWGKRLYLVIYSICKFKCCFCVKWTDEYKFRYKWTDTDIIQIRELLTGINIDEIKTITVGWSEPLTNDNIDDILYFLDSLWKDIEIHTSGSEKWKIPLMLSIRNLKHVVLPIYWTTDVIHDKIVGLKWAYRELNETIRTLSNNNINVILHKLLIKDNLLDDAYINTPGSFSLLHPRDEKIYMENIILLADLFPKILKSGETSEVLDFHKWHWIPICFMLSYVSTENDRNFVINEIIKSSIKIKEKNENENKSIYCSKPEKCKTCILNEHCFGYFKYYFDKFWTSEVKPILTKK